MDYLNDIRTLISKGKLEQAIEVLSLNLLQQEFRDNVLSFEGSLNSLNEKVINGLLSPQETLVEERKISYSLLKFLNQIDKKQTESSLANVNQGLDNYSLVTKLLEILSEAFKGFLSQADIRDQLRLIIEERLYITDNLEYEEFFNKYYSEMKAEELDYHNSIREYTENILSVYNRKALELIIGNKQLKEAIPILNKLERHLLVWLGKYETSFKATPSISLIYTGVREKVPFPPGVELELKKYLKNKQ